MRMKVGLHIPQWGANVSRDAVLGVARNAEAAGLDSVWVADHIVFPAQTATAYPYRRSGIPFTAADGFLEPLTVLALIAGATEKVKLGTSVLVLPMRPTLLLAKELATLDLLSGGRVVLAVGSGWWQEEFEAVGAPFRGRVNVMCEQIEAMQSLWTLGRTGYVGGTVSFPEVTCLPLPAQPGGPPILIGGMSLAARRLAATRGTGWHAVTSDPQVLTQGWREVCGFAADAGRDPATLTLSTSCGLGRDREQALRRLEALASSGVDQVVLNALGSPDDVSAAIFALATEVLPQAFG
jgi:probable F420-dependent oxidoreductase